VLERRGAAGLRRISPSCRSCLHKKILTRCAPLQIARQGRNARIVSPSMAPDQTRISQKAWPGCRALRSQRIAAVVAKRVRVNREGHTGALHEARNQRLEAFRRNLPATL
jgi:hypothetical protein